MPSWVMYWVFGWSVFVLVTMFLKGRERRERLRMVHEERMKAIEKGVPLPELPPLEDEENHQVERHRPPNPKSMLMAAAFLSSIGVGLIAALLVMHHPAWPLGLVFLACSGGCLLGYFIAKM